MHPYRDGPVIFGKSNAPVCTATDVPDQSNQLVTTMYYHFRVGRYLGIGVPSISFIECREKNDVLNDRIRESSVIIPLSFWKSFKSRVSVAYQVAKFVRWNSKTTFCALTVVQNNRATFKKKSYASCLTLQ